MKIYEILEKAQKAELRTEMEVFLAHLLGCQRLDLIVRGEEEVPADKLGALQIGWTRILDGVPVAYLTNKKEFYGLDFYVDERVLVPRGETERLVEMVLERAADAALSGSPARVLELGVGSGAIAVSIKKTNPDIDVLAVDVSADAIAVANKNIVQHGVDVQLFQSDLLADLPEEIFEDGFDGLVANLPYIGTEKHDAIAENVQKHEPALALFAGSDGLRLYARLFDQITELASKGRGFKWIMGEIGFSQGPDMKSLAAEKLPEYSCEILEDYQGLTRYFVLEDKSVKLSQ